MLLVGIALTALLALVAVASRGQDFGRSDGAARSEPPTVIGDYLFTLFAIMMPIGTVLLIVALMIGRRQRMLTRQGSTAKSALILLLVVAAVSLIAVAAAERYGDAPKPQGIPASAERAATALKELDQERRELEFRWLAAVVVGGVLVGIVAASVLTGLWKRRLDRDPERLAAEALAEELDLTVDDLRYEPDLRRAVVAAYARMERSLALHGLARRRFEAPLEYLARVLGELQVTDDAVSRLTFLFERAKFSTHPIGPEMRDDAIAALVALRDDLRAINARDRPPLKLSASGVPVER